VKRHYVELGIFGVASDFGYIFYHNLDYVLYYLFLFVWMENIIYIFIWIVDKIVFIRF